MFDLVVFTSFTLYTSFNVTQDILEQHHLVATAIGAVDLAAVGSAAVGEHLAVDLNVDNVAAGGGGAAGTGGVGVVEIPLAKVGKGPRVAAVLENPLGILEAEGLAHVAVGGGDLLASSQVLEGRGARVARGGVDGHANLVAALDGELGVVVDGSLGPPLVPGADGAVTVGLDTGLEDGGVTAVTCDFQWVSVLPALREKGCGKSIRGLTVNADPSSGTGVLGLAGDVRNLGGSGDGGPAVALLNGTAPGGLDLGLAGTDGKRTTDGRDLGVRVGSGEDARSRENGGSSDGLHLDVMCVRMRYKRDGLKRKIDGVEGRWQSDIFIQNHTSSLKVRRSIVIQCSLLASLPRAC